MIKNINIKTRARTEFVDITSRVVKELFHIKKKNLYNKFKADYNVKY
jgi:thiamine phosphate synthase YjbQ (UPF0047 family)